MIKKKTKTILRNPLSDQNLSRYIHNATSDNTRRAYRQDILHFEAWGGMLPCDSKTVIQYLHDHAEALSARTLQRRLVALRQFHTYQGFADPTEHPAVQKTMTGILNTHGKPRAKAPAMRLEQLEHCLESWEPIDQLKDARDQAILCVGFFGALRGSEILGMRFDDVSWQEQGITVVIPRSKTDQSGEGQQCALPVLHKVVCPVKALKNWITVSGIESGFLFRSIRSGQLKEYALSLMSLNTMIKREAVRCQFENADKYSSHSLRRGLATSASAAGASFKSIMRQGRWRHEGTVLEYIEEGPR